MEKSTKMEKSLKKEVSVKSKYHLYKNNIKMEFH